MKTIKIRRNVIEVRKGDYILDNGACLQFISGDGRTIHFDGWYSCSSTPVSEAVLKKQGIKLNDLRKEETGSREEKTYLCRYYLETE